MVSGGFKTGRGGVGHEGSCGVYEGVAGCRRGGEGGETAPERGAIELISDFFFRGFDFSGAANFHLSLPPISPGAVADSAVHSLTFPFENVGPGSGCARSSRLFLSLRSRQGCSPSSRPAHLDPRPRRLARRLARVCPRSKLARLELSPYPASIQRQPRLSPRLARDQIVRSRICNPRRGPRRRRL